MTLRAVFYRPFCDTLKQKMKGFDEMDDLRLEVYWSEIPIGKENAVDYPALMQKWSKSERQVRKILSSLSSFDNGDDYILVRSALGKGFYRTDDAAEIMRFRKECINKGRSLFAPVRKIDRVLNANTQQYSVENNLRVVREEKGLTQAAVCEYMKRYDGAFDKPMLSRMENSVCLPTPYQLALLARLYGCLPQNLIDSNLYSL